jgi:hypothetical protein
VYHIHGALSEFLLLWMLLCVPIVYIMRSSIASLLYIAGITVYAAEAGYWSGNSANALNYWGMLLLVLPYYFMVVRNGARGNFITFHNWLLPVSVTIALGIVSETHEEFMYIAYISLFGFFCLAGDAFFKQQANNGYKILGSLGTVVLLLILSSKWFWQNLARKQERFAEVVASPEFIACVVLTLLAGALLARELKKKPLTAVTPITIAFPAFILIFIIGLASTLAVVLINLLVLAIGIITIRNGSKENHLGILNYGLLIVTALVMIRFFDTDLSFVTRGSLFICLGIGFLVSNFMMFQKRKGHE